MNQLLIVHIGLIVYIYELLLCRFRSVDSVYHLLCSIEEVFVVIGVSQGQRRKLGRIMFTENIDTMPIEHSK